ncbi:hypothetical protein MRX96_025709 [Rhipicephalus microplus]
MSGWAENNVLTDLQNGFPSGTDALEDNFFVLIQTIAMARKESRNLYGCFLDLVKAYDSVPHESLFQRMSECPEADGLTLRPISGPVQVRDLKSYIDRGNEWPEGNASLSLLAVAFDRHGSTYELSATL